MGFQRDEVVDILSFTNRWTDQMNESGIGIVSSILCGL